MKRAIMFAAVALLLAGCGESGNVFGFDRGGPDEFTVVRNPPLSVPPDVTLRPPEEGAPRSNRDLSSNQARDSLLASSGDTVGSAGTLVTDQGASPYDGGPLTSGEAGGSTPDNQTLQPQAATTDPAGEQNTAVAGYPQTTTQPAPRYGTPGIPIRYGAQSQPSTGEVALTQRVTAYYGVEPDIRRKVNAESGQLALEQDSFINKLLFWKDPEPTGTALDANAESRRLRENDALGKPANAGKAPIIARTESGISALF